MRPYRLVTPAYRDLQEILEYLSSNSASAASRFLLSLDRRLRLLAEYPHMGVKRSEFGHPDLRFVVHANYVIAYDPESKPLTVIAIRHGARSPDALPGSDE